jgi:putative ABC transport system substrate-binding protein
LRRRDFIALAGSAAAFPPLAARAQSADGMRRLGILAAIGETDPEGQARLGAFRKGLDELGLVAGRNLRIDYRWTEDTRLLATHAQELVGLQPDVLFAASGTPLDALRRATQTIPIVFAQVPDPVGRGFVASLARPGGNITGFTLFEMSIAAKWLELLKQLAPRVATVGIVYDPANSAAASYLHEIEPRAPSFDVKLLPFAVRDAPEIERAMAGLAGESNPGLLVLPGPASSMHRSTIVALAATHRLPAVYPFQYFARDGGLASYGVDNYDLFRRAASYVDRVLKGEKPGDLPIQQAIKFELVINLKTAKALGLDVPISLLARTDEVIE